MSPRTIFLSRLLGLFMLAMSLSLLLRGQELLAIMTALINDAPMLMNIGMAALLAGLAIVLCHNIWSGGARPIVVTLFGWILLLSGWLLLMLPHGTIVNTFQ